MTLHRYEVYSTRWDDPRKASEILPARGLEFSLPLSDHGECAFSVTAEPGRSMWRPAIAPLVSGVMVCRDGQPVWSGMVWSERQTGARTFEFQCAEWGSFFERVPAAADSWTNANDHLIFRELISNAQAVAGQDIGVELPVTTGAAKSDLTINTWDDLTVERAFRELGDSKDGPEWYFHTTGSIDNPRRVLVLGDRLGDVEATTVLEYVEARGVPDEGLSPVSMTLLGNLFPGSSPLAVTGARGGNVIAPPMRVRDASASATATIAIGSGEEKAQVRKYASSALLAAGYPRLTYTGSYTDVKVSATLQRHADADLAARAGLVTGYTLTTWDDDGPDWTQVPRGSTVRSILDTDVYGTGKQTFDPRLHDIAVSVGDERTQVNWTVATTLENA